MSFLDPVDPIGLGGGPHGDHRTGGVPGHEIGEARSLTACDAGRLPALGFQVGHGLSGFRHGLRVLEGVPDPFLAAARGFGGETWDEGAGALRKPAHASLATIGLRTLASHRRRCGEMADTGDLKLQKLPFPSPSKSFTEHRANPRQYWLKSHST